MNGTTRTLLLLVVGGLLLFTVYAAYFSIPERSPAVEWSGTYGIASTDQLVSIEPSADGGYIVACTRYELAEDFWILKTNSKGDVTWSRIYVASPWEDVATHAMQTSDDGYIATGWTYLATTLTIRALLIKASGNGETEWSRNYGFDGSNLTYTYGIYVEEASEGGYILTGRYWTPPFEGGIWLLKTTSDGSVVWNKTFLLGDYAYYVHETGDAGYVVAGTGGYYHSFLLLKTDTIGNLVWSHTYGPGTDWDPSSPPGISASSTSDGGYIIGGTIWSSSMMSYKILVVKTDSNGDVQWQKFCDNGRNEQCRTIRQTADGGYILAGETTDPNTGSSYPLLIKTDTDGTVQWAKRTWEDYILQAWEWGAKGAEAVSVIQSADGGYALAGFFMVNPSDFTNGVANLWIGKLAATPTYVEPQAPIFASLITTAVLELVVLLWLSAAVIRSAMHHRTGRSARRS